MKHISSRFIGLSIIICLGLFLLFITLAFFYYPGGHNFDPMASGHTFWLNFWCDVLAEKTLNEIPNSARPFAVMAGFSLILGILILGINSYRILTLSKINYRLMIALGILSIVTAPGVNYHHDAFLIITATSGFLAFMIFLYASFKARHIVLICFGLLAFLTGFLNFILWLQEHQTIFLPIIQKISTVLFCLWMLTGSLILIKKK